MSRRPAATAAVLAVLIAGCEAAGVPSRAEQARDTVQGLLTTCARGEATPSQEALVTAAREAFATGASAREGCNVIVRLADEPSEPELRELFEGAEVTRVRVVGDSARAGIEAPGGRASTVELEHVRGRWYVTNTPLPTPPPEAP